MAWMQVIESSIGVEDLANLDPNFENEFASTALSS